MSNGEALSRRNLIRRTSKAAILTAIGSQMIARAGETPATAPALTGD